MGLLWADEDSDLLNGYSWHKLKEPVFSSSEQNSLYGPGHNSFTVDEEGKQDILVYHARPEKNDYSNPLENPNRHAYVQPFTWKKNGLPDFGEPGVVKG
jgi:GH43 family beta-xylosidase